MPARDEAALLAELCAGLERQTAEAGAWSLCLLLDGCRDHSPETAERLAAEACFRVSIRSLAWEPPNAGRARAAALRMGAELAAGEDALFLTTDADSVPAPGWIAAARASLRTCDVATGRLVRDGAAPLQDRVEGYYDRLYALRRRLDPVPWEPGPHHHFTGGANMAFRSGAYLALGGFPPLASGEDAILVDEAQRAGLRVRRDPAMVVRTSSRRFGRAPGGLAEALRTASTAEAVRVAHPAAMAWQYAAHARARAAFSRADASDLAKLAQRLGRPVEPVRELAARSPNAESFAIRVVPAPPDNHRVPLAEAEGALSALERAPSLEAAA